MSTDISPVVIVGAGITGLLITQSLKRANMPYSLHERDPNPDYRGKGWGLTIHWALDDLLALLPSTLIDRLPETFVDPAASGTGDNGNFLFFNLRSGEALWRVPPNRRIRVAREKLRRLLMEGLEVRWGESFVGFKPNDDGRSIAAEFDRAGERITVDGSVLIGCDGTSSKVRSVLFPGVKAENYELPVRLLGISTVYPKELSGQARKLDPFFYQAGDPVTNAFHWFSFLDSPSSNQREGELREGQDCQILVSWPYRAGFLGEDKALDVPKENHDRVRLMKRIAEGWASPFQDMVSAIPEETEAKSIRLEDWVPPKADDDGWEVIPGADRVAMVGDAAHAMTMFRGEAANHGIMDAKVLLGHLLPAVQSAAAGQTVGVPKALRSYREEMTRRTRPAVLNSRQACLDAHEFGRINDESPLIKRRIAVAEAL
jgi:2-polyprenyl-6-methoxyphenol hydroxylase-like FAD-dependent oxidoreductase